jgi:hypothetical protein
MVFSKKLCRHRIVFAFFVMFAKKLLSSMRDLLLESLAPRYPEEGQGQLGLWLALVTAFPTSRLSQDVLFREHSSHTNGLLNREWPFGQSCPIP